MRPIFLLPILYIVCGIASAQNLAQSGWPKNHADLHNSGIHTFANGLRSLKNVKLQQLDPAVYGNKGEGSIAFDIDGTAYVGLTSSPNNSSRIMRILPNMTTEFVSGFSDIKYWSGTALTDDQKAIYVAPREFTFYDWQTSTNYTVDLRPTQWGLFGASPTIVDGEFYIIDGHSNLHGYFMNGTSINNYTKPFEEDKYARNAFVTPATTGNGIFYWCTARTDATSIYAVRMPEAELVWKYNTSQKTELFGMNSGKLILGSRPHYCETSAVISPDGTTVYQMVAAGIFALDAATGSLKWSKSFTSLAGNVTLIANDYALVSPVINPIDGSVIVLAINNTDATESYLWGLTQSNGSIVHSTKLYVTSNMQSAPAVTADGVFYFCTTISCHAVDVKSDPWAPLWDISAENLFIDYSLLSISPDGSIWLLDDTGNGTFYIGCHTGYYIDSDGDCSPCPENTEPFGTSCGFQCGSTMMLYHEKAVCDCGNDQYWDYASATCISNATDDDISSAEKLISTTAMIVVIFALLSVQYRH